VSNYFIFQRIKLVFKNTTLTHVVSYWDVLPGGKLIILLKPAAGNETNSNQKTTFVSRASDNPPQLLISGGIIIKDVSDESVKAMEKNKKIGAAAGIIKADASAEQHSAVQTRNDPKSSKLLHNKRGSAFGLFSFGYGGEFFGF
jgi:hypothetical protein